MLQRLKAHIRNYFGFSQKETNGFLGLLLVMVAALVLPILTDLLSPKYNPAPDEALLQQIVAQLELEEKTQPFKNSASAPEIIAGKLPLAPFNPNNVSAVEWQKMGLTAKLAQRIKNYQAKGGTFKVKEDVAKIYGFPEDIFQRLYPFLDLPTKEEFAAGRNNLSGRYSDARNPNQPKTGTTIYASAKKPALQPFDINKADTTQLKRIKGIGSKRALWIINYRTKPGGFYSPHQLHEVYGLDPEVVDSTLKYSFVAPDFTPRRIYINTVTADELGRHPYIGFKTARAIVAYREQHGAFTKPEELLKIKLLKPEVLPKIKPYLEF